MLYELRILSGLHRGAILGLHEEKLLIGAHQDADVVLVDPGIEESHAILRREEGDAGWVLEANGGAVSGPHGDELATKLPLDPGGFARIGPVWIGIFAEDQPWQDVPAELTYAPIRPEKEGPMMPEDRPDMDAHGRTEPSFDPIEPAAAHAVNAPLPAPPKKPRRIFKPLLAITVVAVVAVGAFGASGYAYILRPEQADGRVKQPAPPAVSERKELPAIKPAVHIEPAKTESPGPALANSYAMDELKKAFRRRMTDADLIKRFDMELGDREWHMRANLDDEETARFERVLKGFITEHHIAFPVNAKVVPAEGMLPFKIAQLVTGPNASIVTEEGDRVYVGDEFKGVRLVSINGNHLTFAGRRKIEIRW